MPVDDYTPTDEYPGRSCWTGAIQSLAEAGPTEKEKTR